MLIYIYQHARAGFIRVSRSYDPRLRLPPISVSCAWARCKLWAYLSQAPLIHNYLSRTSYQSSRRTADARPALALNAARLMCFQMAQRSGQGFLNPQRVSIRYYTQKQISSEDSDLTLSVLGSNWLHVIWIM